MLLAVLAALALAGCASRSTATRTHTDPAGGAPHKPAATVVKTFHAYDAHGRLTVRVGDVASGRCWTASIAASGPGSYRCLAGNQILDPCFVSPVDPHELACLASPWSDAVVLHVTTALPRLPAGTATRPWALTLANGANCVAATGTVPAVAGINLGYQCPNAHAAALVDPATVPARAEYASTTGSTLRSVIVTTIWRG